MSGSGPRRRPLRSVAATLYGTLFLVGLAIPDAVVSSLRELPAGPASRGLLALAEPAAAAIGRTGLPDLFRAARERFRRVSCGGPDSPDPC